MDHDDYERVAAERDRLRAMVEALKPRPVGTKALGAGEYTVYIPSVGVTTAYLDISVAYGRKRPVRQWEQGDGYVRVLPEPTHYYPNPEPPGAWWELDSVEGE